MTSGICVLNVNSLKLLCRQKLVWNIRIKAFWYTKEFICMVWVLIKRENTFQAKLYRKKLCRSNKFNVWIGWKSPDKFFDHFRSCNNAVCNMPNIFLGKFNKIFTIHCKKYHPFQKSPQVLDLKVVILPRDRMFQITILNWFQLFNIYFLLRFGLAYAINN